MTVGRCVIAWCALTAPIAAAEVDRCGMAPTTIVLIGGNAPHNPNIHDAQQGIKRLRAALLSSPDVQGRKIVVRAFPDGWPADPRALAGASTVVLYFDGLERHPLVDPTRRAAFALLMTKGVGLVSLHQAFTLPPDDRSSPLATWLGAARYGMVDRTVERVTLFPSPHAIARGIRPFTYRDEFYPSLSFELRGVTPVATAKLHTEAATTAAPTLRTVAWAFERPGGGRSFGFSGFHYLDTLDQSQPRKLMLNAIFWTAGLRVPAQGVRSTAGWNHRLLRNSRPVR